ncbi:MAG: PA2169 family four-helix-bundle protein [bacterium]
MRILRDPTESAVNFVVRCARQAADLYEDARERVSDPEVEALFEALGRERRRLADRLSGVIESMGKAPEAPDPDAESFHRLLNAARSVLGDENRALLEDRARAEADLGAAIEEALSRDPSPEARSLLEHALRQVEIVRERLHSEASARGRG